jgi:protoheme IX farnesyltransferase
MLPVARGAKATRNQIMIYSVLLAPLGLVPVVTGLGGMLYGVTAALFGAAFLLLAFKVWRSEAGDGDAPAADLKKAKGLFAFSILYLFVLFAMLIVEHGFAAYLPVTLV